MASERAPRLPPPRAPQPKTATPTRRCRPPARSQPVPAAAPLRDRRQKMQFGKDELIHEIGSGGMATVSRAKVGGPEGFEMQVVLKRIRGDLSDVTSSSLQMLLTEARVSAKLRHPSIVQVYELGEVDGEHYLAMELIDGWDLQAVLNACNQLRR